MLKKKISNLYFNEKYRSGFVKKNHICILMKNTDLVFLKKKIQICILIKKNIDLVSIKNTNLVSIKEKI